MCSLTGKPHLSLAWAVNAVQCRHQCVRVGARLLLAEHIELRQALLIKITQHHTGFCVPVAVPPDGTQSPKRRVNNVPRVVCRIVADARCSVRILRLIPMSAGCYWDADMAAALVLLPELFRRARGGKHHCLLHVLQIHDAMPLRARVVYLLL